MALVDSRFSRGRPGGIIALIDEYHHFNNRAGTYLGLDAHYLDRLTLQSRRYDNHANPYAYDDVADSAAWELHCTIAVQPSSVSARCPTVSKRMAEVTQAAPVRLGLPGLGLRDPPRAARFSRHTVSVRYDDLQVLAEQCFPYGNERGHAVTLAYRFEPNVKWRFTLEAVRARGFQLNRVYTEAETPFATQSNLQLAIRYAVTNH